MAHIATQIITSPLFVLSEVRDTICIMLEIADMTWKYEVRGEEINHRNFLESIWSIDDARREVDEKNYQLRVYILLILSSITCLC